MANFADLLKKIANNSRLTPQELDELGRFGTETQNRNSQVSGSTTSSVNLNVNELKANRVIVGREFLSGMAGRFVESTQNAATATIVFAEFLADYNDGFGLGDFTAGAGRGYKEIIIPETGIYAIGVTILFEGNSVGVRDTGIYVNGVLGSSASMRDIRQAVTGDYTMLNFYNEDDYTAGDVLKLYVFQTSGSTIYFTAKMVIRKVRE